MDPVRKVPGGVGQSRGEGKDAWDRACCGAANQMCEEQMILAPTRMPTGVTDVEKVSQSLGANARGVCDIQHMLIFKAVHSSGRGVQQNRPLSSRGGHPRIFGHHQRRSFFLKRPIFLPLCSDPTPYPPTGFAVLLGLLGLVLQIDESPNPPPPPPPSEASETNTPFTQWWLLPSCPRPSHLAPCPPLTDDHRRGPLSSRGHPRGPRFPRRFAAVRRKPVTSG